MKIHRTLLAVPLLLLLGCGGSPSVIKAPVNNASMVFTPDPHADMQPTIIPSQVGQFFNYDASPATLSAKVIITNTGDCPIFDVTITAPDFPYNGEMISPVMHPNTLRRLPLFSPSNPGPYPITITLPENLEMSPYAFRVLANGTDPDGKLVTAELFLAFTVIPKVTK